MDAESKPRIKTRRTLKIALAMVLIIALSIFVKSLSFSQIPIITNDGVVYTDNDLTCEWSVSADTLETNVTWYNGSNSFSTATVSGNTSILDDQYTTKNDVWTCQVTIGNGTDILSSNASIPINNSAPLVPNLLYLGNPISNFFVLTEDTTYYFVINSSDKDGDTLSYSLIDGADICTVISSSTGNISCIATHADFTGSASPAPENSLNKTIDMFVKEANLDPYASMGKLFNFTLIPFNDQASFTGSIVNKSMNSGVALNVGVTAVDEETNYPLNFSLWSDLNLASCSVGVRITNTSSTTASISFNATTTNACVGNWTVIVNVTDSYGFNASRNSSQLTFGLQINVTNTLPNFTSVVPQNRTQGQSFLVWIYANDSDAGDNLTFNVSRDTSVTNCTVSMFNWTAVTVNNSYLNASGYINVSNLTNNHVACRQLNLIVSDQKGGTRSLNVAFNITNTNDAPSVHDVGLDGSMSNQTFSLYQNFVYRINATDPDQLTYDAANTGILAYTSDDARFTPNPSTGIINVTPSNVSYVGEWIINITVSDGLLNNTRALYLNITVNNVPVLDLYPNDRNISQNSEIVLNFTAIELDDENMTMIFSSLTSFNESLYSGHLNISSQNHNGTANIEYWQLNLTKSSARERNDLVGNHRINITFKDVPASSFDAVSMGVLNFTIENENDVPFFDMNQNNESDNITLGLTVKDRVYSILLKATDFDIFLGEAVNESLNFTFYLDSANFTATSITRYNESSNMFTLEFTPVVDGEQYLIINVTDLSGEQSSQTIFFNVSANSSLPLFESIKPYYNVSSNQTVEAFISALLYPSNTTSLIINENTTLTFDALVTNDSSVLGNELNLEWYLDGELIKSISDANPTVNSNSSPIYFDYFSSGVHNVTLVAEDVKEYVSTWTWFVNITNVNRAPLYCAGNLENLVPPDYVIDRTWETPDNYLSYMKNVSLNRTVQRFYDPDDDLTNTGNVSKNCSNYAVPELSSLTFSLYQPQVCSEAEFTFTNRSTFIVVPSKDGDCMLQFIATDNYGGNVTSTDVVWIKFTGVEPSEGNDQQTRRSGGSTSTTQIITVPVELEVDKPVPIKIIAPGAVSVYANKTIYIPLKIRNTWTAEVKGVELSGVSMNATMSGENDVKIKFDRSYFPMIPIGGESDIVLEVSNYRKEGPFEIVIYARVADPEFMDSTSIYISGLEQTSKGDEIKSKVTFAKDMLSENPVCRELNELLDRADVEANADNYDEAIKLVDGVINGCKYLMKEEESRSETPSIIKKGVDISREYAVEIIIGAAVLLLVTLTFYAMAALKRKISEK